MQAQVEPPAEPKGAPSSYFPNLNGLRFFAAASIVVHHTTQLEHWLAMPAFDAPWISALGRLGVIFFFVLSGFLITALLLIEERKEGRVSVLDFYIRRALRIWPLYFGIILAAFFALPHIGLFQVPLDRPQNTLEILAMYCCMLPNLVLALGFVIPYASHTWSIGTEEQFYLIWPLLFRGSRRRYLSFSLLILLYLCLKIFVDHLLIFTPCPEQLRRTAQNFVDFCCIDCMAVGGLLALLHRDRLGLGFLYHKGLQVAAYLTTAGLIARGHVFGHFHNEIYACLFGIIILNLATNPRPLLPSLERPLLIYLGKISYGVYMLHPIAIIASLRLASACALTENIVIYPLCLGVTLVMAALSFEFYEKPFLRLKNRFSHVLHPSTIV